MGNIVGWVEIPVTDIERAAAFYSTVLQREVPIYDVQVRRTAMLTSEMQSVGASLTETEGFVPGSQGPLVYLEANNDLDGMLRRVEEAGGVVVQPRSEMDDFGFYGIFQDTEGNTLAFFQMK